MKFAVISDIHGNMDALGAVIKDIKKENINNVFICGDIALAGAEPCETIDFIKDEMPKHFNIKILQGNTDEMIAEEIYPTNDVMASALKYLLEIITPEQKEYLSSLPESIEQEINGYKYLFVHGSPRKNDENIMPNEPAEKIEEMIKDVDADFIFCGHTHLPAGYQIGDKTVVNVGSVGRPFANKGEACYVVVDATDGVELLHKFLAYDSQKASSKLEQLDFEGAKFLADFLLS